METKHFTCIALVLSIFLFIIFSINPATSVNESDYIDSASILDSENLASSVEENSATETGDIKEKSILIIDDLQKNSKVDKEVLDEIGKKHKIKVFISLNEQSGFENNFEDNGLSLSSFPEEEFKLRYNFKDGFTAEVSENSLVALANDPRVKKVEKLGEMSLFLQNSTEIINATATWPMQINGVNLTGKGQTVCIIDSGANYNHADLGGCYGNNDPNSNCKIIGGWDYCADDEDCYSEDEDPLDINGHGTHVSGIVAADGAIKGVAPESNIIMVKAANSAGVVYDDIASLALDWCIDNSAKFNISVISMSFGTSTLYGGHCDGIYDPYGIIDAINRAVGKDISVVIATGNSGSSMRFSFPSCAKNAIPVSASTKLDEIAAYSNRHPLVKLVAPGGSLGGTNQCNAQVSDPNRICSTSITGGYIAYSGTSMATPHVSGAIALMNQYLNKTGRSKTPKEKENILTLTGKNITDSSTGINYSRINLYNAILSISEPFIHFIEPTEDTGVFKNKNKIIVNVAAEDIGLSSITLDFYNSTDLISKTTSTTSPLYIEFTDLNDGIYYFNATACNWLGKCSSTEKRTVTIDTIKPLINIAYPENKTYNENIDRIDYVTDGIFCWYSLDEGITNSSETSCSGNFAGLASNEGINIWTIYARDEAGNENSASVEFEKNYTPIWNCLAFGMNGLGTLNEPCLISDCDQLQKMSANLTANYALINDIDCSDTINWNSGSGFDPIGDSVTPFTENFNGNGKNISNLYMMWPERDYVGLFGYSTGNISNLNLEADTILGHNSVGTISGYGGNITNCSAIISTSITADQKVGGLVGENGVIVGSSATISGTISSLYFAGGLVGEYGTITNSSAKISGHITAGVGSAGGLVGADGIITDSSATILGAVSAGNIAGGLIGNEATIANSTVVIEDSANLSAISLTGLLAAAGVISITDSYGVVRDSAYGNITFLTGNVIKADGGSLTNFVYLNNNSAYVDSISASSLNTSANVTLYGLSNKFGLPRIYRDGKYVCNETTNPSCSNFTSLNAGNVVFNVSSWSEYSIGSGCVDGNKVYCCGTLNEPDIYTLQNDISTTETCFTINADDVILDLNGFDIIGSNSAGYGIYVSGKNNITIMNGLIKGFGNTGVDSGIYLDTGTRNSQIQNITISNNYYGIWIQGSTNNNFSNLVSNSNLVDGIYVSGGSNNNFFDISAGSNLGINLGMNVVMFMTSNNNFYNITTSSGGTGIYFFSSSDNVFTNFKASGVVTALASNDWEASTGNSLIYNNNYGEIKFINSLTANSGGTFSFGTGQNVEIANNSASVDSTSLSALNVSANVTLYGIGYRGFKNPVVKKDEIVCEDCYNFTSLTADVVVFNVSSWSNYSIGEGADLTKLTKCEILNEANTIYTLLNNITTDSTCFNITANNVTLNLNGFTITGDSIGEDYGVYISGNKYITIKNGKLQNFGALLGAGIYLWGDNNTISNLTAENNSYGIILQTSNYNSLSDIYASNNNQNNIYLADSTYNTLSNIIASSAGFLGDGTSISPGFISDNNIFYNITASNSTYGIRISSSNFNIIFNSTFFNNVYGVYLGLPSNNNVFSDIYSFNNSYGLLVFGQKNTFQNFNLYNNINYDIYDTNWGTGNYFVYNNPFGELRWIDRAFLNNLTTKGDLTFPGNIILANNSVYLNSNVFTGGINSSANVTLYNLGDRGLSKPAIIRDIIYVCRPTTVPSCHNFTSLNAETVVFNVSSWSNYSIGEEDLTPPSSSVNLENISIGNDWIYWNWTNPTDIDFYENILYINGINVANTSKNYYNSIGLDEGVEYTLTINTKDVNDNINATNVSKTARTFKSCVENWTTSYTSCNLSDKKIKYYVDKNSCGTIENLPADNGTIESCDFCSFNIVNTTWGNWQNEGACSINDTQLQKRSKTEYDANYDICYAVTNLPSDLWNNGDNMTYFEFRNTELCDYDGAPGIIIMSPENKVYDVNSILLNITTTGASSVWYNLNDGDNQTYANETILTLSNGDYILNAFASDNYGNINSASVAFSVDLSQQDTTPPEAIIKYDPLIKDLIVLGIDNVDENVSVTYTEKQKGKSFLSSKKIIRTYTLIDDYSNKLVINLEYQKLNNLIKIDILNMTYNDGTAIKTADNSFYITNLKNNLIQSFNVHKQFSVSVDYNMKKDISWIIVIENRHAKRISQKGFVLIEASTDKGNLNYGLI